VVLNCPQNLEKPLLNYSIKNTTNTIVFREIGDRKGENYYKDICVVLNKTGLKSYNALENLKPQTKNKLYVACSRANNCLYFVSNEFYKSLKLNKN
jgi:hypothetical protein